MNINAIQPALFLDNLPAHVCHIYVAQVDFVDVARWHGHL